VANLLKRCYEEVDTTSLMPSDDTSSTPSIDVPLVSSSTKTNTTNIMCQQYNICMPNKAALVMELVGEMKLPEKAPVR
jgi:hypothetical protein